MTENIVATNRNNTADGQIKKADFMLEMVNELGNGWAEDGFGETEISARHAALRSLTLFAAELHKRAGDNRLRAFKAVTDNA